MGKSGEEGEEEDFSMTVEDEGFSMNVKNFASFLDYFYVKKGGEREINWRLVASVASDLIAYGSVASNFAFYAKVKDVHDEHGSDGCNNGTNIVAILNAALAFGIIGVLLQVATTIFLIMYWRNVYASGLQNEEIVVNGTEVPMGFATIFLQDIPMGFLSSTFTGRCKSKGEADLVAIVTFFLSFGNMLSTAYKFRFHEGMQTEVGVGLSLIIIVMFIYWVVVAMFKA